MAPPIPHTTSNPTALHLVARLDDDAFDQVLWLAKGLVAAGWDVIIVGPSELRDRELFAAGIGFVKLPLATRNPLIKRLNVRRLVQLVRRYPVRLIHNHSLDIAWPANVAASRSQLPLIQSIHDTDGLQRAERQITGAIASSKAARVIVAWEFVTDRLSTDGSENASKLRVVHPGIPLESYAPEAIRGHRMATLTERWRLDLDHRIILVPAPISKSKALGTLLEAISLSERRDFAALLVGEMTNDKARLRDIEHQVLSLNIGDRVIFGGLCDDMPAAVMMADIVVLPATASDAVMRLAVQAQAAGKPVVASDVGALPETVLPASTGWLVQSDDAKELARSIDLALAMPSEVTERVAERARAFAAEQFSVDQMVRRTTAVYREIVADAPRPEKVSRKPPLAGAA